MPTISFYTRYYALRIAEVFRRVWARKRIWQLYWELTNYVNDNVEALHYDLGEIRDKRMKWIIKCKRLLRNIMDHNIKVDGGKKR